MEYRLPARGRKDFPLRQSEDYTVSMSRHPNTGEKKHGIRTVERPLIRKGELHETTSLPSPRTNP